MQGLRVEGGNWCWKSLWWWPLVLDKEVFQKQMLEKLIWICSVMLVGAPHGGVSVGVMDKEFRSEVSFAIYIFSKLICNFVWINFSINIYIGE